MKIAVFEPSPHRDCNMPLNKFRYGADDEHGKKVIDTIKYWVNKHEPSYNNRLDIYLLPNTATGLNWAKVNGCQICNLSVGDWFHSNEFLIRYELELHKQALLVTSAGNQGADGETDAARREEWLAVGAVDSNHAPRSYSSWKYGDVVCCGIDGIYGNGTSYASPYVVALTFIYYEKYFDAMGYYPSPKQALQWVKFNSHDVFTEGWDLKTGYGVLKLPRRWEFEDAYYDPFDLTKAYKRKYVDGMMTEKEIEFENLGYLVDEQTYFHIRETGKLLEVNVHWDGEKKLVFLGRG